MRLTCPVLKQINFRDLIQALGATGLQGQPREAFAIAAKPEFFVDPELLVKEKLTDLRSDVVLISARGAAGKSTAATALSHAISAPLWRLQDDKAVSGNALAFSLSNYLETTDVAGILGDSRPTIIVDSLDEARSRVSGTSWSEFLDSMSEGENTKVRLVLLGRERTLEEVWLRLEDAGRSIAWLEISHFGDAERLQYIDSAVARKRSNALESIHYEAARDAVLRSLIGSVPPEAVDTFAGYAPVLDAVAAVLQDSANLFSVSQNYGPSGPSFAHLQELDRLLSRLLARDQSKLKPLAEDLGLDPETTYSPEEQIDWLCHDLAGANAPKLEHIHDLEARQKYIDKVGSFLADHPFRDESRWASAVFRAYVASRRFGTVISGPDLLDVGNESGLLFDLVSINVSDRLIDEWQLAALHASLTAGEFGGAFATVTAAEAHDGLFEVCMSVTRPSGTSTTTFELVGQNSGEITIHGPLESLTIETSAGVGIPTRTVPAVLGPDLFIRCSNLRIEGGSVDFTQRAAPTGEAGDVELGGVTFEVRESAQLPAEIVRRPLPGEFELHVGKGIALAYPWITYRQEIPDAETLLEPSARAIRFLNMLMNLTRTHGHSGDRGAFVMKLQGRQSIKGEKLQQILAYLEAATIIRQDGPIIFLTPQYEAHRFNGKTLSGQRTIHGAWEIWGPIAKEIEARL